MSTTEQQRCPHAKKVRRGRTGVLDALMYKFGRFPWTCRMCGRRLYSRDRGEPAGVRRPSREETKDGFRRVQAGR